MNVNDIDLETVNQVDLSINPKFLDDDDSFGSLKISDSQDDNFEDDRNYQSKTGVIIDLSDDTSKAEIRTITADINPCNSNIEVYKNFDSDNLESTDYNRIDMETEYFDDEDEDIVAAKPTKQTKQVSGESIAFENDSEDIHESAINGEVTKDYWRKLAKKHAASNKRGAYNTHFHLSGNPKADREFFNQAMGGNSGEFSEESIASTSAQGNVTGIAASSGESASFGESLNTSTTDSSYTKELNDLLKILNIEILLNSDNSFTVLDLLDDSVEYRCSDIAELKFALQPYLEDCFIYPLQIATNEKLSTCEEWCKWYENEVNRKAYPRCADDIKYCDLVANHLQECAIEELI